jgi:hypothetical protein
MPLALSGLAAGSTVLALLVLVLAVAACSSVVRDAALTGGAKAMWVVLIVVLPVLGSAVYYGVRRDW